MSLPNDAYGHTVEMTTVGAYDVYLVGGARSYSFATGTAQAAVYLQLAMQSNLILFNDALTQFIDLKYDIPTRLRWAILYMTFQSNLQINKQAYVKQLLTWTSSACAYASTYISQVMAKTQVSDVLAMQFDPSQISADPGLTLLGCFSIVG